MKKYSIVLMVLGLVALLGYTIIFAAETQTEKTPTMKEKRAMVKAAKISMTDAIAIAIQKVPGTIIDSELENENGKNIYSFELVPTTGDIINEVNVNAADGTVISVEDANAADPNEKSSDKKESADNEAQDKAEKQALAKAAKISMTDAIGIVSKKVGGTVIDGELETVNGKTIYTMEVLPDSTKIKTTKRVTLDATSGAVLSTKNLTAAVIAKEKAAEKVEKD